MEWNGNERAMNTGTNIHANIYDPVPALLLLGPRPCRSKTPRKQKGLVKAKMVTLPWDDNSPSPYPWKFLLLGLSLQPQAENLTLRKSDSVQVECPCSPCQPSSLFLFTELQSKTDSQTAPGTYDQDSNNIGLFIRLVLGMMLGSNGEKKTQTLLLILQLCWPGITEKTDKRQKITLE